MAMAFLGLQAIKSVRAAGTLKGGIEASLLPGHVSRDNNCGELLFRVSDVAHVQGLTEERSGHRFRPGTGRSGVSGKLGCVHGTHAPYGAQLRRKAVWLIGGTQGPWARNLA